MQLVVASVLVVVVVVLLQEVNLFLRLEKRDIFSFRDVLVLVVEVEEVEEEEQGGHG